MELVQGSRVAGRFKIIGCLGTGYHGPVFLAKDGLHEDTPVALKALNPGALSTAKERTQVQGDLKALELLNCPSIIKPLEVFEQNGFCAVVSEYVEGRDLSTLLEEGRFDIADIVKLLGDIGALLAEVHQNGFSHNDLTPAHILLTSDDKIRICGFPQTSGSSVKNSLALSLTVGTAHYKSPEFLQWGVSHPLNDIYSWGVIGAELLTHCQGQSSPHRKKTKREKRLWLIIKQAMQYYPSERFQSFEEVLERLEDLSRFIPHRISGSSLVVTILIYNALILGGLYLFTFSYTFKALHKLFMNLLY